MRNMYVDMAHNASIYLMSLDGGDDPPLEPGWLITGVDVRAANRGKGYASALLDQVCSEADSEGVILYLEIAPDGTGLNEDLLDRFYSRRGFVQLPQGDDRSRMRRPRAPQLDDQPVDPAD